MQKQEAVFPGMKALLQLASSRFLQGTVRKAPGRVLSALWSFPQPQDGPALDCSTGRPHAQRCGILLQTAHDQWDSEPRFHFDHYHARVLHSLEFLAISCVQNGSQTQVPPENGSSSSTPPVTTERVDTAACFAIQTTHLEVLSLYCANNDHVALVGNPN